MLIDGLRQTPSNASCVGPYSEWSSSPSGVRLLMKPVSGSSPPPNEGHVALGFPFGVRAVRHSRSREHARPRYGVGPLWVSSRARTRSEILGIPSHVVPTNGVPSDPGLPALVGVEPARRDKTPPSRVLLRSGVEAGHRSPGAEAILSTRGARELPRDDPRAGDSSFPVPPPWMPRFYCVYTGLDCPTHSRQRRPERAGIHVHSPYVPIRLGLCLLERFSSSKV